MLVEFATFPVDKGPKFSKPVAKVIDLIDKSGLKYQTTAMGALIEGNWDEVFALIKNAIFRSEKVQPGFIPASWWTTVKISPIL